MGHAAFWLFLGTLAPYALCLGFYGLRSPWRLSPVGRGLFSLYASIVAILIYAVIVQLAPLPQTAQDTLRAVLLGGVALAGWVQLFNIIRLQRERRDCPPSIDEEAHL